MQSPIRFLMDAHLENSIVNIAPERKAELNSFLGGFSLIYSGKRKWGFSADSLKKEISVSRGSVELLWCASLSHFVYYEHFFQGKLYNQPTVIDPNSDPRVFNALKLLHWAINNQKIGNEDDDWPPILPCPQQSALKKSDENVADELCLVSCAFILHHELAHLRLNHSADVDDALSLMQEKEADIAAAEWLLDGIDEDTPLFTKRMFGIVQAGLTTTALGLCVGNLGGKRHPFSYDRLSSLINRFMPDNVDIIKSFVFAVLNLHFQYSGRELKRTGFQDQEEALEYICNELADEMKRRKSEDVKSVKP